jgi:hypothetical protein
MKADVDIKCLDESICHKHTTGKVNMKVQVMIDIIEGAFGRELRPDAIDRRAFLVKVYLQRVQKQPVLKSVIRAI